MTSPESRGPVVVDADVYGASLVPGSELAERYEPLIVGRLAFISFQTVAELHYGAALRGWGSTRMRKLDAKINNAEVVVRDAERRENARELGRAVSAGGGTFARGQRPGGR